MKWIWAALAATVLAALLFLTWESGQKSPGSGYLYDMPNSAAEAAYCLAVMERIREITHGQREPQLEQFVDEQLLFWRPRSVGQISKGRAALAADSAEPGVNEGAHLHVAIQDCGIRAVSFYGADFPSMAGG